MSTTKYENSNELYHDLVVQKRGVIESKEGIQDGFLTIPIRIDMTRSGWGYSPDLNILQNLVDSGKLSPFVPTEGALPMLVPTELLKEFQEDFGKYWKVD